MCSSNVRGGGGETDESSIVCSMGFGRVSPQ